MGLFFLTSRHQANRNALDPQSSKTPLMRVAYIPEVGRLGV